MASFACSGGAFVVYVARTSAVMVLIGRRRRAASRYAGNPPSAYAAASDVGRGTLDASRALKKLFTSLDDKVVLVGHSQGGHSALAALALAESYGAAAPIVAVAAYAPLWVSQRSWGAILQPAVGSSFPLATSPAGAVSVWYHYTHAELLDGPGEGKKLFKAEKQAAVEAIESSPVVGHGSWFSNSDVYDNFMRIAVCRLAY